MHSPQVSVQLRIEGAPSGAKVYGPLVKRYALRMLRALKLEAAELSVLVCDDRVMRRLNKSYRGIDRPTDVLAFALREGMPMAGAIDALGDIVIAWPTARRQARSHGVTSEREVCLLVAHGLLHLLGFDHATRVTERRMMARAHMLMATALQPSAKVDKRSRLTPKQPATKPKRHPRTSRKPSGSK
jgi:probable rRNA maturation factor